MGAIQGYCLDISTKIPTVVQAVNATFNPQYRMKTCRTVLVVAVVVLQNQLELSFSTLKCKVNNANSQFNSVWTHRYLFKRSRQSFAALKFLLQLFDVLLVEPKKADMFQKVQKGQPPALANNYQQEARMICSCGNGLLKWNTQPS